MSFSSSHENGHANTICSKTFTMWAYQPMSSQQVYLCIFYPICTILILYHRKYTRIELTVSLFLSSAYLLAIIKCNQMQSLSMFLKNNMALHTLIRFSISIMQSRGFVLLANKFDLEFYKFKSVSRNSYFYPVSLSSILLSFGWALGVVN